MSPGLSLGGVPPDSVTESDFLALGLTALYTQWLLLSIATSSDCPGLDFCFSMPLFRRVADLFRLLKTRFRRQTKDKVILKEERRAIAQEAVSVLTVFKEAASDLVIII